MRKVWTCSTRVGGSIALAAICGMLAFPGPALAKGKPAKNGGGKKQEIPVSVTYRDDLAADAIQSDGEGAYVTTKGKDKGKVFLGLGGQLRFGTGSSRSLMLHFTDLALTDEDGDCPPFKSVLTPASMVTLGGRDDNGALTTDQLNPGSQGDRWDLTRMKPGDSARIGLRIGFNSGILWRLQFGDEKGATDLLTVVGGASVDGDDFSDSWEIEAGPVDLPNDLAVASLSNPDTDDFASTIPCNLASMPFLMTVVKE